MFSSGLLIVEMMMMSLHVGKVSQFVNFLNRQIFLTPNFKTVWCYLYYMFLCVWVLA